MTSSETSQSEADRAANAAAAFDPGAGPRRQDDGDGRLYPSITISGAIVFAYAREGVLTVSVDLDGALAGTAPAWAAYGPDGDRLVPVRVMVQGTEVFRAGPGTDSAGHRRQPARPVLPPVRTVAYDHWDGTRWELRSADVARIPAACLRRGDQLVIRGTAGPDGVEAVSGTEIGDGAVDVALGGPDGGSAWHERFSLLGTAEVAAIPGPHGDEARMAHAIRDGAGYVAGQLDLGERDGDLADITARAIAAAWQRQGQPPAWAEFIAENWHAAPGTKADPATWWDFAEGCPPARLAAIDGLRGSMADGYGEDDVNWTLSRVTAASGIRLACVWGYRDHLGFGGDSQFYAVDGDGTLRETAGDLWRWLNDGPATAPASPGHPRTWAGEPASFTTSDLHCTDGLCNYAHEDRTGPQAGPAARDAHEALAVTRPPRPCPPGTPRWQRGR